MGGYIIQRSSGSGSRGINLGVTPLFVFWGGMRKMIISLYMTPMTSYHMRQTVSVVVPLDSLPSTSVIVVLEHSTTVSG